MADNQAEFKKLLADCRVELGSLRQKIVKDVQCDFENTILLIYRDMAAEIKKQALINYALTIALTIFFIFEVVR